MRLRTAGRVTIYLSGVVLIVSGCGWSETGVPEEAPAQQLRPSFGITAWTGPEVYLDLSPPASLTCRYRVDSGRVECEPQTRFGLVYRASFQFLDRSGRPQPRFDDATTDVVNERSRVAGIPLRLAQGGIVPDSTFVDVELTRRGLLESHYRVDGTVSARSAMQFPRGTELVSTASRTTVDWVGLRYARNTPVFSPTIPSLDPSVPLVPASTLDSILALRTTSGPWAESGSRVVRSGSGPDRSGTIPVLSTVTTRYLSNDRAEVERSVVDWPPRRCVLDRPSVTARCDP
jgi:hypothetical protein